MSALAVGIVLSLVGCSMGPPLVLPEQELPPAFQNASPEKFRTPPDLPEEGLPEEGYRETAAAESPPSDPAMPAPSYEWWREFGVEELNRLVKRGLSNGHSLKAAMQRIAQAEAQAGVPAGALLPSMQVTGKDQIDSLTEGLRSRGKDKRTSQRTYQLSLTTSYEIDAWGKNSATVEAALATAQASIYDMEAISITFVADVVSTYFQYLETCDRIAIAQRNIANMDRVLTTVIKREAVGEGNNVEVEQQNTALAQARAVVPPLRLQRVQLQSKLATLIGELPDSLTLRETSLNAAHLPRVPVIMPSELMARRPDIRKAEANLASSNASIRAATGKLMPSFSLSAETGYGSAYLGTLLSPAAFFYSLAANLSATLFDNGKTRSEITYNEAVYAERVEAYRQTIIDAVRDVNDAFAAVYLWEEQEKAQKEAREHAVNAYELGLLGMNIGSNDYLTVLDAQRIQHDTEDALASTRYERLDAAVSLFRSLGGGAVEYRSDGDAKPDTRGDAAPPSPSPSPSSSPSPLPAGTTEPRLFDTAEPPPDMPEPQRPDTLETPADTQEPPPQRVRPVPELPVIGERRAYYIQIASLALQRSVNEARRIAELHDLPLVIDPVEIRGRKFQRIRSGPFASKEEAQDVMNKINDLFRVKGIIVTVTGPEGRDGAM
ncbi:MAG: efflux transporter outer membrane subunit [Alphaproteobacteria bacterium]|nr:efflux transporter outer membrane subunit [Alphaproteobacteria bacterium]